MANGKAGIIPDGVNTFSMVWTVGNEPQPNGVFGKSLASINAALDAVKPLAAAMPGTITSATANFRHLNAGVILTGQARMTKEVDNQWSVTWYVNGLKDGAEQANLSLAAAIDAVKTLKDGLSGTFQFCSVIAVSQ